MKLASATRVCWKWLHIRTADAPRIVSKTKRVFSFHILRSRSDFGENQKRTINMRGIEISKSDPIKDAITVNPYVEADPPISICTWVLLKRIYTYKKVYLPRLGEPSTIALIVRSDTAFRRCGGGYILNIFQDDTHPTKPQSMYVNINITEPNCLSTASPAINNAKTCSKTCSLELCRNYDVIPT